MVLAAAAWLMQALSCGYYLFFLAVLLALWLLLVRGRADGRAAARGASSAPSRRGALLLAPFLLGYQAILRDTYGFSRSIGEIRFFSADVAGAAARDRGSAGLGMGARLPAAGVDPLSRA